MDLRNLTMQKSLHLPKSKRFLQICIPKRDYLPENQVIWLIFHVYGDLSELKKITFPFLKQSFEFFLQILPHALISFHLPPFHFPSLETPSFLTSFLAGW